MSMGIKVIAIGNAMMGDDGIGLYVAEYLKNSLEELGIEVVMGETDIDYCMSQINDKDELIIIDSSCRGEALGVVYAAPLCEAVDSSSINSWQHDRDLLGELKIREIKVSGLMLFVEVSDINFRWGLSSEMLQKLPEVCGKVYDRIFQYRGELKNAR